MTLLNFFCINMMHQILERNKRPVNYLIKKPTLQLYNHQMLSIEIVFHT